MKAKVLFFLVLTAVILFTACPTVYQITAPAVKDQVRGLDITTEAYYFIDKIMWSSMGNTTTYYVAEKDHSFFVLGFKINNPGKSPQKFDLNNISLNTGGNHKIVPLSYLQMYVPYLGLEKKRNQSSASVLVPFVIDLPVGESSWELDYYYDNSDEPVAIQVLDSQPIKLEPRKK